MIQRQSADEWRHAVLQWISIFRAWWGRDRFVVFDREWIGGYLPRYAPTGEPWHDNDNKLRRQQ